MKKQITWSICSFLYLCSTHLDGAIASELAKTTVNVASIKNESDFLVVVQQTEGHKYANGSLRPRRQVVAFKQETAGTPFVDFKNSNLINTPFIVLPGWELQFSTDPLGLERFPVPRDHEGALYIGVFARGWHPDGLGVYVCELRSAGNKSIKIFEVKQSHPELKNTKVISLRNSFRRTARDNYIMFDRFTGESLRPSDTDKEAEYFFTQSEALSITIKKGGLDTQGFPIPLVSLTMKNV